MEDAWISPILCMIIWTFIHDILGFFDFKEMRYEHMSLKV